MKLKYQQSAPQLAPQNVAQLCQAAEQALQRKNFEQNLQLLKRARGLDPANPAILVRLGRSYGLRFNYAAAEECFEKAIRLSNRKTLTMAMAGFQSSDFFNPELVERYSRRAAEQQDATPQILVQLAELYQRTRRTRDAAQLADQALQKEPDFVPALLMRARLELQAGHLDESERLLRSLLPKADMQARVRAYYQLGTVLDRQGRYDEAVAAFVEAKAPLQAGMEAYSHQRQIYNNHFREMLAGLSADTFQRWFNCDRELQPAWRVALLCGYPRSGTTLLEQVLDSHPDIVSAEETEIFYEDVYAPLARTQPHEAPRPAPSPQFQMPIQVELSTLEAVTPRLLRQLRENYFRTMELCVGQRIGRRLLIDKNPLIALLLFGFQRVFPETKLMMALRDPRDVCLSCFMQDFALVSLRHTAFFNLKDTVDQYIEEMNIWRTLAPMIPGRYLEIRYEDVVEDLESAARKTLDFLGVQWDSKVLQFDEHAGQKRVRSSTYADVTKPIYKRAVARWRNYQKYLEPHLPKLEPLVKAFGYD